MVRFFWFCILFGCLTPIAVSFGDEWSQWRGPERDGRFTAPVDWPDHLNGHLNLLWKQSHGPSYSGPVSTEGLLFTTETVDRTYERVTAYELETGAVRWTHQWEGHMAVPFFAAANGDWIRSTPACVPGYLVVLGMRDVLVCLDTETGKERWSIDFPAQSGAPLQPFGAVCSPLIDDGFVYVQLGGGLTKVSLESGEVLWQTLQGGKDMMSLGAFSSPALATIAATRQLVVQTREELCGVSLDDGTVLWQEPIEAFRGMNILTPLVIGGSVFTAAHSGKSQLFAITGGTRWSVREKWSQKTQGYMSSPVVIGDHVYLHMKNERFACLSLTDGEVQWTSPPMGKYWSMVHCDQRILALSADGHLRLIDAQSDQFRVLDEIQVADDSWAHLAVIADRGDASLVVVRALDSMAVYRWSPKKE